jgi:hypothetical protein
VNSTNFSITGNRKRVGFTAREQIDRFVDKSDIIVGDNWNRHVKCTDSILPVLDT